MADDAVAVGAHVGVTGAGAIGVAMVSGEEFMMGGASIAPVGVISAGNSA